MTKEELAKKKGLKPTQNTQTAAESILTIPPKVEELKEEKNLAKKESNFQIKTSSSTAKKPASKKEEQKAKEINKAGRPKGTPSTKISLNIPDEYLELVNIAAGINYKGNKSSYIVDLIKKDIEVNGNVYEQIKTMKQ